MEIVWTDLVLSSKKQNQLQEKTYLFIKLGIRFRDVLEEILSEVAHCIQEILYLNKIRNSNQVILL